MIRAVGLLLVVLALLPVRGAAAGPTDDAREAVRRGTAAYNLGAYEEAAKHYEEAYRLVQSPDLLFNVGQAWRQAGRAEKAITAYRSYLRTAPADAPNRELVERRLPELERIVAETKRSQEAPPPGTLPTKDPAASSSPGPTPAPSAFTLVQPAPALAGPSSEPPFYRRWWFWAGTGAIVVGAAATAIVRSSGDSRATSCGAGVDSCAPVRR